jgi:hypothetical protein
MHRYRAGEEHIFSGSTKTSNESWVGAISFAVPGILADPECMKVWSAVLQAKN